MFAISRRSSARAINIWPGFVDALSALLMVVIFMLMVFMVAQFYLSNILSGQDEMLDRLNRQLSELDQLLDIERAENADLQARIAVISADLQQALGERDGARDEIAALERENADLSDQLAAALSRDEALSVATAARQEELAEAYRTIAADREALEMRLRELASLRADIEAARAARAELESQLAALSLALQAAEAEAERLGSNLQTQTTVAEGLRVELRLTEEDRDRLMAELADLRDRRQALEERLSDAEERTVLAQRELEARDIRIEDLVGQLAAARTERDEQVDLTNDAQSLVAQLTARIAALREQLARVEAALEASEARVGERDVEIANLNSRLNQALLRRVEELSRYRSEFFGRLREVLGDREDVRVVGDRFVFQSEVLFATGSAGLQPAGQEQLAQFAGTLLEIAAEFPEDVDWILRVDGHTDRRPINTVAFPSNWELSTDRATSVVRFLEAQGVPADRLAAAGFGEHQPLDPGDSDDAYERNRRIELKLDQR